MKHIGLVTDIPFWHLGNGQNARIRELYHFLSKHARMVLYYLGQEECPFPCVIADAERLATSLAEARHDVVIVERIHLDWILDLGIKDTRFYLDAMDLMSDRVESFRKFGRECGSMDFHQELSRLKRFDKVLFLQKEELDKVLPFLGADKLLLCPHAVEIEQAMEVREHVEVISFFGGPSWPNFDGIRWFHDQVLPLLGPWADKCIIQGGMMIAPAFPLPNLRRGGMVQALDRHYQGVDLVINPVLYGSGLKIKTVESMAYGVPLVTTAIGAQGLSELAGSCFLVGNTPEAFAEAILSFCTSRQLRKEVSERARGYSQKYFSKEACFRKLV